MGPRIISLHRILLLSTAINPRLLPTNIAIKPTMPALHAHALWAPVRRDLAALDRAIAALDQQFSSLLLDPNRISDLSRDRFVYKLRLNHWFHATMPAEKARLVRCVTEYWTHSQSGRAWIAYYAQKWGRETQKTRAVMERGREEEVRRCESMVRKVNGLFRDMGEMMLLNPAGADPFFLEDGPVVRLP